MIPREAQLLTYLSREMLRNDKSKLLSLMHRRITHSLVEWFSFDSHQLRTGWFTGAFETTFAQCGIITHGERYGNVVAWHTDEAHP